MSNNNLHSAINQNNLILAEKLLKKGFDANDLNTYKHEQLRPIHLVNSREAVDLLLNYGADINSLDGEDFNALWRSTSNTTVFLYLIEKGCNVNHIYKHKEQNLLHSNYVDLIVAKKLIDAGLDVNKKDLLSETPIFNHYNLDIVKLLCENGADLLKRNSYGDTVFHRGFSFDKFSLMFKYLKNPKEVKNVNKDNILHQYINCMGSQISYGDVKREAKHIDMLNTILEHINPNTRNISGNTPLHIIAMFPDIDYMIEPLLNNNVDIHAKNKQRHTAIELAGYINNINFISIIEKHLMNQDIKEIKTIKPKRKL